MLFPRRRPATLLVTLLLVCTGGAIVVPSAAPPVVECASIPVNLAFLESYPVFRETDETLEETLRGLGHPVRMMRAPACDRDIFVDGVCRLPAMESGTGAVTLVSTVCAHWDWFAVRLPAETVVVQWEPLKAMRNRCCLPQFRADLEGKVVWDDSHVNIRTLQRPNCALRDALVELLPLKAYPSIRVLCEDAPGGQGAPPAYDPSRSFTPQELASHPNISAVEAKKDVDVLMLVTLSEIPGERRYELAMQLVARGLHVEVLANTWAKAERQAWIARAKVVLNVHRQPPDESAVSTFPLETMRLQYVLSNGGFVVSETADAEDMRPFAQSVVFAPYAQLADTVVDWLRRPAEQRARVAAAGYALLHSPPMEQALQGPMQRAIRHLLAVECRYHPRVGPRPAVPPASSAIETLIVKNDARGARYSARGGQRGEGPEGRPLPRCFDIASSALRNPAPARAAFCRSRTRCSLTSRSTARRRAASSWACTARQCRGLSRISARCARARRVWASRASRSRTRALNSTE